MFLLDPGFEIFYPGSQIPDPGSGSATKNLNIFNLKIAASKLSAILYGIFIPDPDFPSDPGSESQIQGSRKHKKHRFPDPHPQHWFATTCHFFWFTFSLFLIKLDRGINEY
jgi:hypothetical protein